MIGDEKIRKLSRAHVILFGLGGVGSFAAEALARSGLGTLSLVEYDRVALSNRNRQLPALSSTVGKAKIEVASERLKDIHPEMHLHVYPIKMTGDNLPAILDSPEGLPDFIADAIDDLPAKAALIAEAKERGIPIISSMGAGFRLDPSRLTISDISQTHTCPLARKLRRNLREKGIDGGVPVVWSGEKPAAFCRSTVSEYECSEEAAGYAANAANVANDEGAGGIPDIAGPASMIFVPAAAGLLMASYIVRQLIA